MPERPSHLFTRHDHPLALIIDAGTTNIKVSLLNRDLNIVAMESAEIEKRVRRHGRVEQDPEEIFIITRRLIRRLLKKNQHELPRVRGIGLTNQRETTILWNKRNGRPVHAAILWLDTRTKQMCAQLRREVSEKAIRQRTGLVIDPYFSATKIRWLLQNIVGAQVLLDFRELAFGTVDSWLIYRLTGGRVHATDYTNASRTLLFHIRDHVWDQWLLQFFHIHPSMLPEVKKSFDNFGLTDKKVLGYELPIQVVMGDQQASLYAVGNRAGATKITYGTGAFILQNIGRRFFTDEKLYTTLAVGRHNRPAYAVEGKVSPCGDLVKKVLGNEKRMRQAMRRIARHVDQYLKHLPKKYHRIVIDGGVTRDGIMADEQARVSSVPIIQQPHFEVTTIGTAKLLFDNWK